MTDPFGKITPGDNYPLSASFRNAMVDMHRWWQQQGIGGFGGGMAVDPACIVYVKNGSGGDLTRFSALAITNVFPDPADNENSFANGPILTGATPVAATEPGNFCVLLEPAKDGVIVRAAIAGVTVAKINVNDADDTTCGVDTTTVLQSGLTGAQILWKESGTGTKWAIVRIGGGGVIQFAKLDADLNQGSSCTASIWSGDPLADSGDNKTVYDWFLESSMKLESGVKVMLTPISGKLYVTQSDTCPVAQ